MNLNLSVNTIISGAFIFGFVVLTFYSGRLVIEAIQQSNSLDQQIVAANTPILQQQKLKQALGKLGPNPYLVIEASGSANVNITSEINQPPKKILITNHSGVSGAGRIVREEFKEITDVTVQNGEEDLDETALLYKNGYRGIISEWQERLDSLGWKVGETEELQDDSDYDIHIKLGR